MSTLKARCPECNALCRYSPDDAENGEIDLTCAKCGNEFGFEVGDDDTDKPATTKAAKPESKAKKSAAEDDAPRKKKKKKAEVAEGGPNKKLIGGIVGGVLLLAIIGAVLAFGGKDKPKDVAKNETPAPVNPDPGPAPKVNPNPLPNPKPKDNPNPLPKPKDKEPKDPLPKPKPKNPDDDELPPGFKLPAPPVIRIATGSAVPKSDGPVVARPPAQPPLSPEEDPFVRAKEFRPEGALPALPKLPPVAQRPLLTLDCGGHSAIIRHVFITPKGDRVVTVSEDKAVRIWDSSTGDAIHTVRLPAGPGDEGSLLAATMSPSGKRLAVAGLPLKNVKDGAVPIFLIGVDTGTYLKTIGTAATVVTSLDFSNNGNMLAVGCADGRVQLFDVATSRFLDQIQAHAAAVREVKFNPNPKNFVLATIGGDATVRIFDLKNKANNSTVGNPAFRPTCIDWSSDGKFLAVGGQAGAIAIFGLDGQLARTLEPHKYQDATVQIFQLQFLKGDKEIACCGVGGGGWAGVKDADTGKVKVNFTSHSNTVAAVNVSADGTRVVSSGGNQHETFVWDATDGTVVSRLCGQGNGIWGIGWAKDGKSIAFGIDNRTGPNDTRPLEGVFRLDDFGITGVSDESKFEQGLRTDDTYAIARRAPNEFAMGALKAAQGVSFKLPGNERIYSASVLPGRRMVVVGGAFSQVLVDPQDGRILRTFTGHTGHILAVAASPDGKYFVTGSSDQTIRIWQAESEEPLLSLFVAGREWIAWTTQGYYACSPYGERLIAWQVNAIGAAAAYRFPQVHPAARFRPSMYQPAIIKYLIPAGNMPLALAMAQKYDKALVQTTSVADINPPEVTLESPAPPAGKDDAAPTLVIDKDTITVKATAKGTKLQPITSMRLLVDGRPFGGAGGIKRFEKPDANAEATWDVPLTPGPHSFAVIADSPLSKGMSKVGTLIRSGEIPKPNLYMLAIGVSAYEGENKLRYAASDAKLLAKTFQEKSKGVFGEIEIRVLTDAEATKKGMQEGLDWLKSKMTPKDVGIVSFSGHGVRDPFGRFYLVPVDIKDDDPAGTCFSGDEFKSRLENMPGRLVAILDACHSGTAVEKTRPPARADGLVRDLVSEDAGVVVMCASQGREYALESKLTKAGFFTLGLVEGHFGSRRHRPGRRRVHQRT